MVSPFQFARLPLIYFGCGKRSLLPGFIGQYGSSVILVTGRRSFIESVNASRLLESLRDSGIVYHLVSVGGEPSPDLVDETVSRFRDECPAAVVSIGGGSVIDAAREQWNDGTNTLAVAPGEVIAFSRNYVTNGILRDYGVTVHEIPSAELSRGRGGPRCMSMPLWRE